MPRNVDSDCLLLSDCQVARMLGFSRSWMRQQRFKRKHNLPHHFDLDPVWIGTSPRYRVEDVKAWIERLATNAAAQ